MKLKNKKYELNRITFHTPSDHYQDGAPYDMEVQLHHMTQDYKKLVVSIFVDAMGGTNKLISKLWRDLPSNADERGAKLNLNPEELLPIGRRYYTYEGSMTTPPCTENTTWIVMERPIRISIRQLNAFRKIIKQNSRPVQKRSGKKLKISRAY